MSGRGKKNQQCRFFNGNPNSCNKGDKCPFLHTSPGGSVGQKQPCRNFTPGNPHSCKFGAKCSFSHQGGGRAGDPPLASPFGPSLGNQIGAQGANPFGQAPSNPFGAATNPFGAAAGNPFGATAAPSNPFGAAAPNPFGTAAATANPFGATAGLPTSAGSKSCGMDQGPNGQQGTCQEMLNLALPASAVSRNLAEMRSGGKLWALTCLTHRSMAALTPNDVDGDKSPEVYSMHVTRLLDASIRLCVLMSSTRIQEVRWEYVKSGAGGGCCGTSSVALQIDQAIQAHVQQLSNFVAQAGSDPNFGSHLAQEMESKKGRHKLDSSGQNPAQPAQVGNVGAPANPFGGQGEGPSVMGAASVTANPFGGAATNPGTLNGAGASASISATAAVSGSGLAAPSTGGAVASADTAAATAAATAGPPQGPAGAVQPTAVKVARSPLSSEQKVLFLASEISEYSAPAFTSLATIPVFPLPHTCDLA